MVLLGVADRCWQVQGWNGGGGGACSASIGHWAKPLRGDQPKDSLDGGPGVSGLHVA